MHIVFWIIFGVVLVAGLFFYGRCQLLDEKVYELEDKLCEAKAIRHRAELMQIKDLVDEYRKDRLGTNAYSILAKISDVINKTALERDQTD